MDCVCCVFRRCECRMCGTIISFAFLDFSEFFVLRAVICGEVVLCCLVGMFKKRKINY